MALTPSEMEAKIEAIEDRIALLSQTTGTLESRFDIDSLRWTVWAMELQLALTVISAQIERVRDKIPLSGQEE